MLTVPMPSVRWSSVSRAKSDSSEGELPSGLRVSGATIDD